MKRTYNPGQRLMVSILLISFSLQSCSHVSNHLIAVEEEQAQSNQREESPEVELEVEEDKKLIAQEGSAVSLYPEEGREKVAKEAMVLANLQALPILQNILSHIPYPAILEFRKVNYRFYELITGYSQIGLLGVAHKPNTSFCSTRWIKVQVVDFSNFSKGEKSRNLTPESIPSFFFYRIMGEVKGLPQTFWPYILGTQVHTLNLKLNQIGPAGARELGKALPKTQVHTLNLKVNRIGYTGVQALADALPKTQVHTLNLGGNAIGGNEIGNAGAQALAKALPNTQIHTLNLGYNEISASGAQALADVLSNTQVQVHTLNLEANQIGASGARKLADALPKTQVHTLHLKYNAISAEMQQLLRQEYPNITWYF